MVATTGAVSRAKPSFILSMTSALPTRRRLKLSAHVDAGVDVAYCLQRLQQSGSGPRRMTAAPVVLPPAVQLRVHLHTQSASWTRYRTTCTPSHQTVFLSILAAIFPRESGLSGLTGAKDDGCWWWQMRLLTC